MLVLGRCCSSCALTSSPESTLKGVSLSLSLSVCPSVPLSPCLTGRQQPMSCALQLSCSSKVGLRSTEEIWGPLLSGTPPMAFSHKIRQSLTCYRCDFPIPHICRIISQCSKTLNQNPKSKLNQIRNSKAAKTLLKAPVFWWILQSGSRQSWQYLGRYPRRPPAHQFRGPVPAFNGLAFITSRLKMVGAP